MPLRNCSIISLSVGIFLILSIFLIKKIALFRKTFKHYFCYPSSPNPFSCASIMAFLSVLFIDHLLDPSSPVGFAKFVTEKFSQRFIIISEY